MIRSDDNPYRSPETGGTRRKLSAKARDRLALIGSAIYLATLPLAALYFVERGWEPTQVEMAAYLLLSVPAFIVILLFIKMPIGRR